MKKFPAIPGTMVLLNFRYDIPLSFCIHLRWSAILCARLIVIMFLLKPFRNFDTADIRATLDPSVQLNTSDLHAMAQTIRMHRTCIRLA